MGMIFLRSIGEKENVLKSDLAFLIVMLNQAVPPTLLPNAAVECSGSLGKWQNQLLTSVLVQLRE